MNKQVVTYLEARSLFLEHCDIVLKDKHLRVFDYYLSVQNILNMLEHHHLNVYKAIVYKWSADIGLHIVEEIN